MGLTMAQEMVPPPPPPPPTTTTTMPQQRQKLGARPHLSPPHRQLSGQPQPRQLNPYPPPPESSFSNLNSLRPPPPLICSLPLPFSHLLQPVLHCSRRPTLYISCSPFNSLLHHRISSLQR